MQDKDAKVRLLPSPAQLLASGLDVLLQLLDRIFERGSCVVDLVHDEDVLAHEVGHLQGAEVQPLCTCDLGAGFFFGAVLPQVLVQRQPDGLDGDIWRAGLLEERSGVLRWVLCFSATVSWLSLPKNAGRHVASTADGDHKVWFEFIEDLRSRELAQLVHLPKSDSDVFSALLWTGMGSLVGIDLRKTFHVPDYK